MTSIRQVFCTAKDVVQDMKLRGFSDDADLMDRIKAASDIIMRKKGNFIPISETRKFETRDRYNKSLYIPPILSVTSLTVDSEAVTDYHLKPYNKLWPNGPYICIELDEGSWADEDDNVVEGSWGLYDQTASLGISASQSTTTETTLAVTNGALLSPGMVLLIGSEQEYVSAGAGGPGSPAASAATSKLNGAIVAGDTEITVDAGSEFNAGEVIQIGVEDLYIQKIGGNVLAVVRGYNGTTPASHDDDSAIRVYRTFTVERGVNGTTAAVHSSAAVYRYVVPDLINHLCRQIAGLMRMKAESGWSGVTGNNEMGSGNYYSEFPPRQMAEVLDRFDIGE